MGQDNRPLTDRERQVAADIGIAIYNKRTEYKLTKMWVAKRMKHPHTKKGAFEALSRLEDANRLPNLRVVIAIADVLEIPLSELFTAKGELTLKCPLDRPLRV